MNDLVKTDNIEYAAPRRRWYDEKPYTTNILGHLKNLSIRSHYEISREVIRVVDSIKEHTREQVEPPLSIGLNRVFGLFQEYNKRRWYDNSLPISRVFKSASTLQREDYQNVMQGIAISLEGESID